MSRKLSWTGNFLGMVTMAALAFGCAEVGPGPSGPGAGTSGSGGAPAAVAGDVAAGTQGDTLKACIDRIPDDATGGQQLLAERSCHRDEANRQPIKVVPGP